MGTTRNTSFQDMLNEYLPNDLLKEELIKRDYVLTKVNKDNNWKGGKIIVPFKAAGASSVKFNALTASTDIAEMKTIRGSIDAYQEVWGSMIFNHGDILEHDGKVNEQSFLKILPDTIEDFMQYMKEVVSNQLTAGPYFAKVTDATNAATGVFVVDRIEKFMIDQKVSLDDDNSSPASYYVTAIDLNTNSVTIATARGGSTYTGCTDYTVDQNAKFYYDGVTATASSTFVSLKSALLSYANGGSQNLHGKVKTAYPFLQAINISGSDITAENFLDKLFDAYATVRRKARGKANEAIMSYKHFGTAMKQLELVKGAYKVSEGSRKANVYGWTEIEIQVVASNESLKLVGIQELDDDVIMFMDWSGITFRSNGFFRKRTAPDGKQYYEVRAETGYTYIIDISLFGELEVRNPGKCGIIHTISY